MTELHELSLCEARANLRAREVSSVELTEHTLARVGALEPTLRAFATVTDHIALRQAQEADEAIARGEDSPVLGIPIALKDLCAAHSAPTHAGTVACRHWRPGLESTVARRLRVAGGVLVGKLTTTEGASGVHHPSIPAPKNPWNPDYWTGASSSGSGAATAAGLCFGSLGSDTGGSIRFPSQCCGLVGIKATWGRVSRFGVFPLAPTLDHVGPMTRRVEDAAAMLQVIAGRCEADTSTFFDPLPDYEAACAAPVRGLRVGVDEAALSNDVDPAIARAVERAIEVLVARGAERRTVQFPERIHMLPAWLVICGVEAALSHADFYPERGSDYGPALSALLDYGQRQTPRDWSTAQLDRLTVVRDYERVFDEIDLLVSPATRDLPPTLEEGRTQMRGDGMRRLLAFTAPGDLTGYPTISLPAGLSENGVPFGFQITARPLREATLLRAAGAWQEDGDWVATMPSVAGAA